MYQFAGPIFSFPVTKAQLLKYSTAKDRKAFSIEDVGANKIIGHGEINKIDYRNKNARLCRILVADENDRNKGYGSQIISGLLQIGFNDLGLHRIDLGVFEFNKPAIKCYEKCGFKIEGLLRDSFVIGDEFYSVYNMSILKEEWKNNN
jgi:RimJ/RimL family protein N-acetyltransferase